MAKFIEVTDEAGDKSLVNIDKIVCIRPLKSTKHIARAVIFFSFGPITFLNIREELTSRDILQHNVTTYELS